MCPHNSQTLADMVVHLHLLMTRFGSTPGEAAKGER